MFAVCCLLLVLDPWLVADAFVRLLRATKSSLLFFLSGGRAFASEPQVASFPMEDQMYIKVCAAGLNAGS